MSLIKFELKPEHITLIKHLKWTTIQFPHIKHEVNPNTPFTDGDKVVQDVGLILHGYDGKQIQPDTEEDPYYTQDQINEMKQLYEELPMALDIICFLGTWECGWYKTRSYLRDWVKFELKKD